MAFDNPDFGRKNYEEYLRAAREILGVKYLTKGDREGIKGGIYYLIRGDDLLKHEDPESLREDAWLFLAGGYYLGGRCVVSDSEAKYWEIKKRGGPKPPRESTQNKKDTPDLKIGGKHLAEVFAKKLKQRKNTTNIVSLTG